MTSEALPFKPAPAYFKAMLVVAGSLLLCILFGMGLLPPARLWTILLLTASVCFLFVRGRGTSDLMHPIRVFGALWCFCLGLASMHLLPYLSDWDFFTWNCLLTGLGAFIVGFCLVRWWTGGAERSSITAIIEARKHALVPTRKTLIVAAVCLVIGTAVLGYEFHLLGEIPIFSDNPDVARFRTFGDSAEPPFNQLSFKLLNTFVGFIKYGIFLSVITLCQRTPRSRKATWVAITLITLGSVIYVSQAGRSIFVLIAIACLILFHYLRRPIRAIELVCSTLVLMLFLGIFGSLRLQASGTGRVFQHALSVSSFPQGPFWEGIAFGYATVTASFEIFARLLRDLQTIPHEAGYTLYGLHYLIPRANLGEVTMGLYLGEFATATFLIEFYADYGYWGIFFASLITGIGYGWVYSRGGGKNPLYWICVRALLIQLLVVFPYANLFTVNLLWCFDLFFMYFLLRWISGHRTAQASSPASS